MDVAPTAKPVACPDELIVATEVVPLAHAPPVGVQVNVVVPPMQPFREPAIADGETLIVIVLVLLQPPDVV